MLKGKVTYIGAAGLAIIAVYQYLTGDQAAAFKSLAEAMTLAGLRRAVG